MTKLNGFLLILCLVLAMVLISMRAHTKDYFGELEQQRALNLTLEEEYKVMQLKRAELTNINRIKKKAANMGMVLPDFSTRRVIEAEENVNPG